MQIQTWKYTELQVFHSVIGMMKQCGWFGGGGGGPVGIWHACFSLHSQSGLFKCER